MRYPTSVAAVLLLAGCASVAPMWSKPGATRPVVADDVVDCERQAQEVNHGESCAKYDGFPIKNPVVFDACMRARGYARVTSSRP